MALSYVGRAPVSEFSVVPKSVADARYDALVVDDEFLEDAVATSAIDLVTPSYVDTQDSFRATKAAVDAADANYLLATTRGAANGVASLDGDVYVPSAQLPTLNTNRKVGFKNVDTVFLSGSRTVTTTNAREYEAARLTIADPGFPYIPLPFCTIRGGSVGGSASSPSMGTGNYGQVTILDASLNKWGWCITGGHKVPGWNMALPFADSTINPTSRPPITGSVTLSVWLACWTGTTYTFDSAGLQFYALIYPGV